MNIPRRNHYVPKMLSRRFTGADGKLYFYNKRIPENGIQQTVSNNLFVKKDLYNQFRDNEEKDTSAEDELSSIESDATEVLDKIVGAARSAEVPGLTSTEKNRLDVFIYHLWKRTPDFHNDKLRDHRIYEEVKSTIDDYEKAGSSIPLDLLNMSNNSPQMDKIRHNMRAMASLSPSPESLRRLGEKGLRVVAIYDPNEAFIIGSRPILELRSTPNDTNVDLFIPLAYDVAIQPFLAKDEEKLKLENKGALIRALNKAIMEESTIIAGRSYELIESLVGVQ